MAFIIIRGELPVVSMVRLQAGDKGLSGPLAVHARHFICLIDTLSYTLYRFVSYVTQRHSRYSEPL